MADQTEQTGCKRILNEKFSLPITMPLAKGFQMKKLALDSKVLSIAFFESHKLNEIDSD